MSATTLDRYEIVRPLARGGMAQLYLARRRGPAGVERLVVIKQLLPELLRDADMREMFIDEIRIAAALHHPNIVDVYDFDVSEGSGYLVMEYLRGIDVCHLQSRLAERQRDLPLDVVLWIASGVAMGLHHAHEQTDAQGRPLRIVHRDVSPQNVFITREGHAKLLDFGIATAVDRINQTRSGVLKGKIGYLSPEQCRARPVDRRSDVFSHAALIWEMVTGRRLFSGRNDFAVMAQILEQPIPRPSSLRPDIPKALEAIIMRGLQRDPEERFPSAQAMGQALEGVARDANLPLGPQGASALLHEIGVQQDREDPEATTPADDGWRTVSLQAAPSVPRKSRSRGRVGLAILATLMALGVGGGVHWATHQAPAPPTVSSAETPPPTVDPTKPQIPRLDPYLLVPRQQPQPSRPPEVPAVVPSRSHAHRGRGSSQPVDLDALAPPR